jgi:hypothetical protein
MSRNPNRIFARAVLCAVSFPFMNAAVAAEASDILSPPPGDGPVVVDVGFYLSDVSRIAEEEETVEFEGILTVRWHDDRLAFDPTETGFDERLYQGSYQFSEVFTGWWPQIFLANESGGYERQGVLLRVSADGDLTYVEEITAIAEARMDLRLFPFDHQRLYAMFEVLGFTSDEVTLRVDPSTTGLWDDAEHWIRVPHWHAPTLTTEVREYKPDYLASNAAPVSAFVVEMDLQRAPGYMVSLVLFPLTTLVILSWSVFWMSRSTLADRMDVSFIGILTIVAYQITISELMPRISYMTILTAFLIISFLTMCASVVVNLAIGRIDGQGHFALGDRVDQVCRWAFPLVYAVLVLVICGTMYVSG